MDPYSVPALDRSAFADGGLPALLIVCAVLCLLAALAQYVGEKIVKLITK